MKKVVLSLLRLACFHAFSQSGEDKKEEAKGGFKKERLFTGGSATAGFSSYSTILGITPQFGYSVTNWADLGITFNLNHTSQGDYETYGDRLRQTVYGPGAFVRLFPVNFLFATAQYEYNMIHLKYLPAAGSNYSVATNHVSASCLL